MPYIVSFRNFVEEIKIMVTERKKSGRTIGGYSKKKKNAPVKINTKAIHFLLRIPRCVSPSNLLKV